MAFRSRLWIQIAATLAVNLTILALLALGLGLQQTNSGLDSFLYAPARERVRELGRMVEEEFPRMPEAQRTAWLGELGRPWGLTVAVFEDTGIQIAGPVLSPPASVRRELRRSFDRGIRSAEGRPPGGARQPMFLIRESNPSRYWFGYRFPIVMNPGSPPVRHTLAVVSASLLSNPFFFDWWPWIAAAFTAALVTLACWVPLVRRFTRSIHAVQSASAEIAQGRFDVEIPVRGNDELADLSRSVSQMSAQLSRLVHGQRRFLTDVAHELCAPLSRVQLSVGILTDRLTSTSDIAALERLERDVTHISALVGDLLAFTRGNVRATRPEPIPLADIVAAAVAQESTPDSETRVDVAVPPAATVMADHEYLTRAVANVLRNAIRYAGYAGPVTITAAETGDAIRLTVEDCGPGLAEADLEPVFAPFYRPDVARTPGTGGVGLGLAIVRTCVEACGGTVSCRNREPRGLAVTMVLRRATPVTDAAQSVSIR